MDLVGEAFDEAFEIIYSEDGWKEEKKNDKGDVVVSKKSKKGQKNPHHFRLLFQAKFFIFSFSETLRESHTITASKLDRLGAKLDILPTRQATVVVHVVPIWLFLVFSPS